MKSNATIWVVGSLNADLVQMVDRMPEPGETLMGDELRTYPGGKGANQAYAAAKLGGTVRMIGNVGKDELGGILLQSLRTEGVDVSGTHRVDASTGAASILVMPDGENAIVISPGANGQLTPEDVRARMGGIEEGDFLLCQLETPVETVSEALQLAKRAGATTILDPAPASEFTPELLASVSIVTPNETESQSMLEMVTTPIANQESYHDMATRLRKMGAEVVLLKLGDAGCFLDNGSIADLYTGHSVTAVDTTAAGDIFNGALAVRLAAGGVMEDAIHFANASAGLSVTRPGAQTSVPDLDEVENIIVNGQ